MHFHSSAEEILHNFPFHRETKGKASENMKWLHNKSLYQQSHCKNPTQNQHSILPTWICLWKWVLAHFSSTAAISFETPVKRRKEELQVESLRTSNAKTKENWRRLSRQWQLSSNSFPNCKPLKTANDQRCQVDFSKIAYFSMISLIIAVDFWYFVDFSHVCLWFIVTVFTKFVFFV